MAKYTKKKKFKIADWHVDTKAYRDEYVHWLENEIQLMKKRTDITNRVLEQDRILKINRLAEGHLDNLED